MSSSKGQKRKLTETAVLLNQLRQGGIGVGQHQRAAATPPPPQLSLLRTWQSERLARTYADMLHNPRYRAACRFFLTDVYAPRDFSQRDHDAEQVYNSMRRFLPGRMLHTLGLVIELNRLTHTLDALLLSRLVDELGVTDSISAEQYAEAYRRCDNYAGRVRQIELTLEVGRGIDRIVRLPLVGAALRMARGPAHRTGWFELQDFLERGFAAFKRTRGAKAFLDTIEERERRILDGIYTAVSDPFAM